jgi:antitoxin component HigA of HigAB toxin-antitoxin module|nr:hypothetical protein [Phenylobacterium sp.]
MASANPPPLRNEAEFEHALSEVERLLEEPHLETLEDRWFNRLLVVIADYHDDQPRERRDANLDRLKDLEGQLKSFGKRWPDPDNPDGSGHWSPMLGGDLDPNHHGR